MVNNVLQYIYDINGSIIDQNLGSAKRLSNLVSTFQVVAPFPATDSCIATVQYATGSTDIIFLRIAKDINNNIKKGSDVIDESHTYYQDVVNYNVWEMEIPDYILTNISKFRSGKIDVSFTFREFIPAVEGSNYLGSFGSSSSTTRGDLPETGTFSDYDYYVCLGYNYFSTVLDQTVTYQQAVYWINSEWTVGTSFTQRLTTAVGIIPVDLALNGLPPQSIDPTLTEQFVDRLAALEAGFEGSLDGVDSIVFNKDFVPVTKPDGMLYYDNSTPKQTLTFVNTYPNGETQEVNIGQELYGIGKNVNGFLPEGAVVAYQGVQGDHLTYVPAKALYSTPELNTMIGVLTTNVDTNEYGPVVVFGQVDISDFSIIMEDDDDSMLDFGTKLYLSADQQFRYTTVVPDRPNAAIWVATVLQFNPASHHGIMFVNPIRLRVDGGGVQIFVDENRPSALIAGDFWYELL